MQMVHNILLDGQLAVLKAVPEPMLYLKFLTMLLQHYIIIVVPIREWVVILMYLLYSLVRLVRLDLLDHLDHLEVLAQLVHLVQQVVQVQ